HPHRAAEHDGGERLGPLRREGGVVLPRSRGSPAAAQRDRPAEVPGVRLLRFAPLGRPARPRCDASRVRRTLFFTPGGETAIGLAGLIQGQRARLRSAAALALVGLALAPAARAATSTLNTRVTMSDGVSLQATVTGEAPLVARPVIAEFSPYGAGTGTTYDGTAYNYLLVQIRGTGASDGRFDALGDRTQRDVAETLGWACGQPWSDG